jgi:hypothetical protein
MAVLRDAAEDALIRLRKAPGGYEGCAAGSYEPSGGAQRPVRPAPASGQNWQETGECMTSDTLSEAVAEMRGELMATPDSYRPGGPLTVRILGLITEVQQELEDGEAADLAVVDRHYQRDEIGDRRPPV